MRPHELPEIRHLPLFRDMMQANFETLMQAPMRRPFPPGWS